MGENLVVVAVAVAVVVVVVVVVGGFPFGTLMVGDLLSGTFVLFFLRSTVLHPSLLSSTISSSMKLKCILPLLFGSALFTCCPLGLPPGRRC